MHMALLLATLHSYSTLSLLMLIVLCHGMFVNMKVMRPLLCALPASRFNFLNSMSAIILLFPLLNTNQIWEQCQPVSEF